MPRMTGGEAIGKTLAAYGVECVFGMTVTTEVPLTMSLIQSGIKMMTVRSETAGSMMATGYSKISGKPGVCLVSGAGSAHAALGMYEANLSSNAIVVISSDSAPTSAWRPGGTYLDQLALFQQVTKWAVKAEVLQSLPDMIARALRVATTGAPGPVAVIVPGNLFGEEGDFQIPTPSQPAMHPALRAAPRTGPPGSGSQGVVGGLQARHHRRGRRNPLRCDLRAAGIGGAYGHAGSHEPHGPRRFSHHPPALRSRAGQSQRRQPRPDRQQNY